MCYHWTGCTWYCLKIHVWYQLNLFVVCIILKGLAFSKYYLTDKRDQIRTKGQGFSLRMLSWFYTESVKKKKKEYRNTSQDPVYKYCQVSQLACGIPPPFFMFVRHTHQPTSELEEFLWPYMFSESWPFWSGPCSDLFSLQSFGSQVASVVCTWPHLLVCEYCNTCTVWEKGKKKPTERNQLGKVNEITWTKLCCTQIKAPERSTGRRFIKKEHNIMQFSAKLPLIGLSEVQTAFLFVWVFFQKFIRHIIFIKST